MRARARLFLRVSLTRNGMRFLLKVILRKAMSSRVDERAETRVKATCNAFPDSTLSSFEP